LEKIGSQRILSKIRDDCTDAWGGLGKGSWARSRKGGAEALLHSRQEVWKQKVNLSGGSSSEAKPNGGQYRR